MTEAEHTVVTVRSVSVVAPICWVVSFVVGLAFASLGLGGLAMVVLGSLCFTTSGLDYCETINTNGKIALVAVGAILLCCCFRVPMFAIRRHTTPS